MRAWFLVLGGTAAAGVLGLLFGALLRAIDERNAILTPAKENASFIADEVIRRATVHYRVDDPTYGKGTVYEHCWASPAQDYLYKTTVRANADGKKFMTLAAYELPHGDKECRCTALQVLLGALLGQLRVVREERFTDDDANGELEIYVSYMRGDHMPFVTPRDRDIGDRAGVQTERTGADESWRRYAVVLKEARGHLEPKKK